MRQIYRSDTNKLPGLVNCKELKQARDKRFNPKFTSTKEAMSPLRIPQREGNQSITKSLLSHPIPAKEDWCSLIILHKGEGKYKGGTQRVTPNRLEASFKSKKCESKPRDASSALEMTVIGGALKASQNHTLNHFLTQALAQGNQTLALGGRGGVE
jgi:hypothetical protein